MIELNEQEMELNQPTQMPNEVHSPSNMLAPLQKSGGNIHQKMSKKELMLQEMQSLHKELRKMARNGISPDEPVAVARVQRAAASLAQSQPLELHVHGYKRG